MKRPRRFRRTTILTIALGAFLFGLVLARKVEFSFYWFAPPFLLMSLSRFARSRARTFTALGFVLLFLVFGIWRGSVVYTQLKNYQNYFNQNVSMQVTAKEDAVYSERRQLVFRAGDIEIDGQKMLGDIEVEGFGTPAVYRGDVLKVQGKLFPKRGSFQAGVRFASLEKVSSDNSPVNQLRRNFAAGVQNTLPEPLASFGLGLLIGQRSTLDIKIEQELIAVGLIHIVAVSGYNLTVLTNFTRRLFSGRSRYQALVFGLLLIFVFLLLTGNSASIVRAAVVSVLSLLTWYFGRRIRPMLLLLLSGALTAGVNPIYVWSDIGWYLSFTAFFGVLVLSPLLVARYLSPENKDKMLPNVLSETFAAQLCTLPIILFIFGRLSVVSIIANLLVVPLVPFAMLASLVAGMIGMLKIYSLYFLALPAKFLLGYMLEVSTVLSKVPHANVELKINAWQLVIMYLLIILLSVLLWQKTRKNAKITDQKARFIR